MPLVQLELEVNGTRQQLRVDPERTLLSVLREELDLTGAKYGCGEGSCGACTVLIDGQTHHACKSTIAEAAGKSITTIEGLERDGALHPVQQAFLDHNALQCGYCTPGMILGAVALLQARPHPTEDEIRDGLNGHLCRCGAYQRIVAAVQTAAGRASS